jgi:hypothetical protein
MATPQKLPNVGDGPTAREVAIERFATDPDAKAAEVEIEPRVLHEPPPDEEVEAMHKRGFALTDGAYRPRSRSVVVA